MAEFFIDTHCHINTMIKKEFDRALTADEIINARSIIDAAAQHNVHYIINVGTSLIESINCIKLAKAYSSCAASIGIHPNDCTSEWQTDIKKLQQLCKDKELNNIVAIGECGMDFHYPDYNKQRQEDAFKAQINLALENNLPVIVHTRQAPEETLRILESCKDAQLRGVIHCFSEGIDFAREAIQLNFVLGIGGTITYPKNNYLREVVTTVGLDHIILETDAPFLPPQNLRGKQNLPENIAIIGKYIAELFSISPEQVAQTTTQNALKIFKFNISK